MTSLQEKYRPKKLSDIKGQGKAVAQVRAVLKRRIGGRAFWISGASGTGKTTLARIIAGKIASDFFVEEYDSAWELSIDKLREWEQSMILFGGGKGGRAYIINEAHGLRQWVIQKLLGLLERLPGHVVFIFTTTQAGQSYLFEGQIDAGPLLSRCTKIDLRHKGLEAVFARHCKKIAKTEKLDGQPLDSYLQLAKEHKCNLRSMLMEIETGTMKKKRKI